MPVVIDWAAILVEGVPRLYDFFRNGRSPASKPAFQEKLNNGLRNAIDIVASGDLPQLSPERLEEHSNLLLRTIAIVVKANIRDEQSIVNANYMTPIPVTDTHLKGKEIIFCQDEWGASALACALELRQSSDPIHGLSDRLLIPVAKRPEDVLFGAPAAFATGAPQVIRNTAWAHLKVDRKRLPEVRLNVKSYFTKHGKGIKSFTSLPIESPPSLKPVTPCTGGTRIGVVNVHADKRSLTGVFQGNQQKIHAVLIPLLHLLSYYVVYKHFRPAAHNGTVGQTHFPRAASKQLES